MNAPGKQRRGLLRVVATAIAVLALLPLTTPSADAQETTQITVTSFAADGATPLPFVRFQITDDSTGTVYGPLETPFGSAQVVFTLDLVDPNATFTIAEETPPPCGIAPDPLVVGPLEPGDNLQVEFATDFEDDCDLGGLSAYKYACPDGFDASATDYATWSSGCTEEVNGATFEFISSGGFAFQAVTGAYGIPGRAPYTGLNPDTYTIGEIGAAGTPTVFCLTYGSPNPAAAPNYDSVELMDLENGVVTVGIDGNRIACDFFYAQGTPNDGDDDLGDDDGGDDDDDTGGADTGNGSLEFHKALCPAGYEPNNEIFNDCHGNGLEGIEFTIDGPGGYFDAAETVIENDPGPGIVRFTGLDEGTYSIHEEIPGHDNEIFVYCSLAQADDQVPFDYNTTGGIDIYLGDGVDVICDWYNIPIPGTELGTIRVTKYTCDVGYDPSGSTWSDFLDDCPDTTQGVTFTLTPDGGGDVSRSTNSNGAVRFDDLVPSNYQVSEDVPGEFATPYVFCTVDGGNSFQADTSDGSAYFYLDGGIQLVDCDWFNVPEDLRADASVTLTKYLCPEGQSGSYALNCDDLLGGVTFEAAGPNGYNGTDTTGDNGRAVFADLVAGTYVITEYPPDDPHVAVYVVACTSGGSSKTFSYDDSTGLRITLKLNAGEDVRCDWYNVPPKPGPKGSITIEKFLCQGKEDNDYDWDEECESYGSGAAFDLLTADGDVLASGTTDADGFLVFTGLADGAYGLDETNADWCHAEADRVDAKGNVIVEDEANTDVFIYNCTKKQVNVLPSTGVGSVASGAVVASGVWALAGGFAGLLILLALRRGRLAPAVANR